MLVLAVAFLSACGGEPMPDPDARAFRCSVGSTYHRRHPLGLLLQNAFIRLLRHRLGLLLQIPVMRNFRAVPLCSLNWNIRQKSSSGRQMALINHYPVWSPDGDRIAFNAGCLYTMSPDGSDVQPVVEAPSGLLHSKSVIALVPPVWSPDGQRLGFRGKRRKGWSEESAYRLHGSP